ncbi:3-isopropylmalate dehydratase small subunit [candidate division LCP-89 bacterium B3_LCP]|uniref:3-isopropylmalate dehydratase small subunit n=1 Tax=candidate division LCP-89 bacterium B3_LCP TaxID=2012998 RepID=A0A532UYP0_UNCL8|nr:MAG: 3-isopropylmalate dehydratase small subunit [candidate division LCP-89 bacterium B3_LCP]
MKGTVFKYGDNVDTDVIIPARYCTSFHKDELAPHCLEDLDETFASRVKSGDIIVAGRNFGCGSSRENAPLAILGAGVGAVVAQSFARIFYRNSINVGLPILECPQAVESTDDGDVLSIDLEKGEIENLTKGGVFTASPFPESIRRIIDVGGLEEYVRGRIKEQTG